MSGSRSFVPVVHAATEDRPDEIDTIVAAEAVASALKRLGFATRIVALGSDLAELERLRSLHPLRSR